MSPFDWLQVIGGRFAAPFTLRALKGDTPPERDSCSAQCGNRPDTAPLPRGSAPRYLPIMETAAAPLMKPSQSPISTANIGRALTLHGNESCSQIHSFPLFTGERVSRDAPIPPFRRRRLPSPAPFTETSPSPRYTRFHHLQKIEFPRDAPIPPFRRRRLPSLSPFSETSPPPRYTRFHHLQKIEFPRDAPIPPFRHRGSDPPAPFPETSPSPRYTRFHHLQNNEHPLEAPTPAFRHRGSGATLRPPLRGLPWRARGRQRCVNKNAVADSRRFGTIRA